MAERVKNVVMLERKINDARGQVNAHYMSTFVSKDARELCRPVTNTMHARATLRARHADVTNVAREVSIAALRRRMHGGA